MERTSPRMYHVVYAVYTRGENLPITMSASTCSGIRLVMKTYPPGANGCMQGMQGMMGVWHGGGTGARCRVRSREQHVLCVKAERMVVEIITLPKNKKGRERNER